MKWYCLYWESPEGTSGSQNILGESRAEVEAFFEKMLAPRGYKLLSCQEGGA